MTKKAVSILCVVIFLTAEGCITFKIEAPPEPQPRIENFVLCKRVIPDGVLLAPLDITTDFVLADLDVFCFVELKSVGRPMTLKWKWYAPDGVLFKETAAVTVNENRSFLEVVTAYDRLDMRQGGSFEGRWVVLVLVDGKLAGRRTFKIR